LKRYRRSIVLSACFAIAPLFLEARSAQAQFYSTQQGTPQGSPQSYQSASCYCPFPQGYCPFPQGFCALPMGNCGTPMPSPQESAPSAQMTPQYSYQGYFPRPYASPKPFVPRPIGIPGGSMPSSQRD
jgi:hypothetical protein